MYLVAVFALRLEVVACRVVSEASLGARGRTRDTQVAEAVGRCSRDRIIGDLYRVGRSLKMDSLKG